ncbi:uncharacterized protein [Narcine bancroftii]|uniref:uncharacterized protein n=1 Tax=Narcine bancroftii TaxID=1343680 RepID=UPI003831EB2F
MVYNPRFTPPSPWQLNPSLPSLQPLHIPSVTIREPDPRLKAHYDEKQDKIKAELGRMQALSIIAPVSEPTEWMSSKKKYGQEIQICINPRDLNIVLKRLYHPHAQLRRRWRTYDRHNEVQVPPQPSQLCRHVFTSKGLKADPSKMRPLLKCWSAGIPRKEKGELLKNATSVIIAGTPRQKCLAQFATCSYCGKLGHFVKACKAKSTPTDKKKKRSTKKMCPGAAGMEDNCEKGESSDKQAELTSSDGEESHLTDKEHLKLKREWVGQVFYSSFNSKAKGVAILVHKNLQFQLQNEEKNVFKEAASAPTHIPDHLKTLPEEWNPGTTSMHVLPRTEMARNCCTGIVVEYREDHRSTIWQESHDGHSAA